MIGPSENPGFRLYLRKVVPKIFLREREAFLRLGPKAGLIYLRLRLFNFLGVRTSKKGIVTRRARSVLFVCHGNIMRSPMAEAILKRSLTDSGCEGVRVASAGLHATPGKEAHPLARAALEDIGLPLANHRAELLTAEMVNQADVVFAMDFQNEAELLTLFPKAQHKILLLGAYAEGAGRCREIPDPFLGDLDTTRQCRALLENCVGNLTAELSFSPG